MRKFFVNPEPIDVFLFWFYMLCGVGLLLCAVGLYSKTPSAGVAVFVSAVIAFALAENRRSGWFFWCK